MCLVSAAEIMHEKAISATEIPAIAGISRFGDEWTVYAKKFGIGEPEPPTEEMIWGIELQPTIARVFGKRMDVPVEWFDRRVWSRTRPWQCCTPDALILTDPKQVLECKTTSAHKAGDWDREASDGDGAPDDYVAQVTWQLSTLELDVGWIAVLIGGNDFRTYRIERDPALERILLEAGEDYFLRHVMGGEEPAIGGSDRARNYLRKRYPREREKLRPATLEETEWLGQYAELRGLLHQGEVRRTELENQITLAIGDAEGLEWERGRFTWKRTKDRRFVDWKALAEDQLALHSEEEKKAFRDRYTRIENGYRRIHFSEAA